MVQHHNLQQGCSRAMATKGKTKGSKPVSNQVASSERSAFSSVLSLAAVGVACLYAYSYGGEKGPPVIGVGDCNGPNGCRWDVECSNQYERVPGCHPKPNSMCGRVLIHSFVEPTVVDGLLEIAKKGMMGTKESAHGGPTILDINSGYRLDAGGVVNINEGDITVFTPQEYELYGNTVESIRQKLQDLFGAEFLYFTAPTFITRIVGNQQWMPKTIHDEYWHHHVDKNNTSHYDYSGLLYLSDYGTEFTGGKFAFQQADTEPVEMIIKPARGALLAFTAGMENPHQVRKVTSGTRYVLSLWFTCDAKKEFSTFLDGKVHRTFQSPG